MKLSVPLSCVIVLLAGCTGSAQPIEEVQPDESALAKIADNDVLPSISTRKAGVDWPSFLGPNRDSVSTEVGVQWGEDGPPILWTRKLGPGYGIGSVAAGRLYQYDQDGDASVLLCLNAETGAELWSYKHALDYDDIYGYDAGPRCSPVIDGNRVYIYGVDGSLHCLTADAGKLLWKLDLNRKFRVVQNFFGVGSTPIVEGDLLLVMVGGSTKDSLSLPPGQLDRVQGDGSGIVAFNKMTGEVVYSITDELASYASIITASINGRRWGFAFCREHLIGFEPTRGQVDFKYRWRAKSLESVNASTPVIVEDGVFISETYGPGSSLLRAKPGDYEVVWADSERSREKSMQAHWNTPVYLDGYLYGSSGRHTENAELRCIDWKTGKVQWSQPRTTRTSLLLVDGYLINLGEYGNLQLIKPDPKELEVVAETTLRDENGAALLRYPCWAAPIVSHGLMYVRGKDKLVCLELIPQK